MNICASVKYPEIVINSLASCNAGTIIVLKSLAMMQNALHYRGWETESILFIIQFFFPPGCLPFTACHRILSISERITSQCSLDDMFLG